jgi:hypothetical protein
MTMKALIGYAAVVCGVCFAGAVAAEPKSTPKPSVCLAYALGEAKGQAFAICYDSDKPALFSRFAEVTVPSKEGAPMRVLVGWR